jgi:peroxiredoxin
MPNSLTDDYDVVVHLRTRILNGLLANFHRSGGVEDRSPRFLHSLKKAFGGVSLTFDEEHLLTWVQDFEIPGGLTEVGETKASAVSARVPPGLSRQIADAVKAAADAGLTLTELPQVKGKAEVQVSAPRVELEHGATSTVRATIKLRAYFVKHTDSVAFPRHVLGEVRAQFSVTSVTETDGKRYLDVTVTSNDNELTFTPYNSPAFAMPPWEVAAVSKEIRRALRGDFAPMSVELGADFPFQGFNALGGSNDAAQVVALPLTLDGSPPPGGLAGLHNLFLHASDHFGVAVSKEYIEGKLQGLLGELTMTGGDFTIEVLGIEWATYTTTANAPTLTWKSGEIEIVVTGSTTTTNIVMPDYHWTIKQRLTLQLDPATQGIDLVTAAPLEILGLEGLPSAQLTQLRTGLIDKRNAALANAQADVDEALTGEFSVRQALTTFDNAPGTSLTAVEISPQGVILRGQVQHHGASNAQVAYEQVAFGGFSALWSWMPGGWIDHYLWSWKVADKMYTPWGGTVKFSDPLPHTFRLPPAADKPNVAAVCLQVYGEQTTSAGSVVPVSGGEACKVSVPGWMVATMPKWYDLLLPIWELGPALDESVEDAIMGHINLLARSQPRAESGGNSLVHFVGARIEGPLDSLSAALSPFSGSDIPLALTLVLQHGRCNQTRRALERQLGTLRGDFTGWLMFTEDYQAAWSRAFGAGDGPETFATNAMGEFVWRYAGIPNRTSFASLGPHLLRGRPLELHPLELGVRHGERGPDFLFREGATRIVPFRTLRGRRVELCFWKSCSTPCLRELGRLQRRVDEATGADPMIIGVNGGEDATRVEAVRRELELTFPLVVDAGRRLTRQYDVHCWPTVVRLDEDGRVDGAQFGASRPPRQRPVPRGGADGPDQAGRGAAGPPSS